MLTWIVAGGVAVLALLVVVLAVALDPVPRRPRPELPWTGLPAPHELRDATFPLRFRGYDPETVDTWVVATAEAFGVLSEEAGPDAVSRARARLGAGTRRPDRRVPPPARGVSPGEGASSGEELEDRRGDGAGVLDR